MSKIGYAILIVVCLALGIYVFRPAEGQLEATVRVFPAKPLADYEVLANGLHQRVTGQRVAIAAATLPLNENAAGTFWGNLTALVVPEGRIVRGVGVDELSAYGIDATARRLWGDGVDMGWGSTNGEGYCADRLTGTVYSVGVAVVKKIDQLAGRLDAGNPLPADCPLVALEVGKTRVVPRHGVWMVEDSPMRPNFRLRVEDAMHHAREVRIADLAGGAPPADAVLVASLRLEVDAQAATRGLPTTYDYRFMRSASGAGLLAVNDLPVQKVDAAELAVWQSVAASFAEDRLFNLGDSMVANPVERVLVERGAEKWFRLESTSGKDMDDFSSRWDVVWDGGREFAAPDSCQRLVDAFNDIAVRDVRVRPQTAEAWPDALRMTLLGKSVPPGTFLEMRGSDVRTATHVGVAVRLADMLEKPAPDHFLDTMLAGRSPERALKIQRRFLDRQPAVEEILTRNAHGGWSRSWPRSEPVESVAVQRIARVIATSRALSARLATAADRAIADAPTFEIAVRFGPKPAGKANDFTDLEDTTTSDLALALIKDGDHWRALAIGTGTAYDLDDELVGQLRQSVADPLVLPLIPALVRRLQIEVGDATVELVSSGDDWLLAQRNEQLPARRSEVRRLLRDLAGLTATRRGPGGALEPGEIALKIDVYLPGFDRESEHLLLQVGKPGVAGAAANEVALYAESTRPGAMERSRAFAPAASVAGLAVERSRFLVVP